MTYGLDTSVVLCIVTGEPAALAEKVEERISELLDLGEKFFVGNLALGETYFALQHHYGKTKQEAIEVLRALASEEGFVLPEEAKTALAMPDAWKASPGFVDRMIFGEYAARGYKTISCEKSFRRLDFAEVIKEC